VFLLSPPRSGSTLLTRILNSHSKIASPFEIGVPFLFFGDQKENDVLDKTIRICDYFDLNPEQACEDPGYYLSGILKGEGKDLLVIKDPKHSVFLPKISIYFGDVPIIHLTKDVRTVCQSNLFDGNYAHGMNHWLSFNQQIISFKSLFSRYLHVRYEDLIADPEKTVSHILGQLGHSYEEGIVNYWDYPHTDDKLKLWNGLKAKDSALHQKLAANQIINTASIIPTDVLTMYAGNPQVRSMNEYLGY
jgi:hypothetical protein